MARSHNLPRTAVYSNPIELCVNLSALEIPSQYQGKAGKGINGTNDQVTSNQELLADIAPWFEK